MNTTDELLDEARRSTGLHDFGEDSFHEALDRAERIYLRELMETRDAIEGIAAFREKREPRWEDA